MVSAKGTRDDVVIDYLKKFGQVASTKVIYGVFTEGPLRGMRNGDRSYKVELKPKANLGSYHVIDGAKVTLRFPGQQKTCARCHKTPAQCKGKGVARQCEAEGGVKVDFVDYILDLWREIGYSPDNVELGEDLNLDLDAGSEVKVQEGGIYTPAKCAAENTKKFTGVSIKTFPKEADHGDIIDFLVKSGLPRSKTDNVTINGRGTATIRDVENSECLLLIEAVHGKKNFERKLFCNGIVPLTPDKTAPEVPDATPLSTQQPESCQVLVVNNTDQQNQPQLGSEITADPSTPDVRTQHPS